MSDQISEIDFPDSGRLSGGVEAETRSTPAGGHAARKLRPGAELQSLTVSGSSAPPAQSPSPLTMSRAMQLCGYGALPNGRALIEREQQRESITTYPDFSFSISRSLEGAGDQEIELAIEVKHYRAPGDNGSLDHRDPTYEAGEVEFGDAVSVVTGKTIELTRLELEAAETAFWNQ